MRLGCSGCVEGPGWQGMGQVQLAVTLLTVGSRRGGQNDICCKLQPQVAVCCRMHMAGSTRFMQDTDVAALSSAQWNQYFQ